MQINTSTNRRFMVSSLQKLWIGAVAAGAVLGAFSEVSRADSAAKPIVWKMVTTWPKNFPGLGTGANDLAKLIEEMSNKRITVKVYGAGELVPALSTFDAVSRGTAQMGHGAAYYWKGKHEAAQFFAAIPFGLNAQEMEAWIHNGGGQALWDELYAPFGLKPFSCGNTGVQMGGWFNKEIKTVQDFKGLKMRMPGLGGDVLSKLGGTVVTIAGGDIFQALRSGTIDAAEWVGPSNDLAFGLNKAAKYYYWPGWHEPGTTIEAIVNKKAYDELPADLQAIVRGACQAASARMLAEFTARDAAALETLVNKHGVQLRRFPDEVLKRIAAVSKEVVADIAKKDPMSKKIHDSFMAFRKRAVKWNEHSEAAYSTARALTP